MIKDLFVDNNVAKNFKNPADPEYVKLMNWLYVKGHLVVTPKLMAEYYASNQGNFGQSIISIINQLTIEGRLVKVSNDEMKALAFPKKIEEKCQRLKKDYWHVKAILLSNRKMAIIIDEAFRNAVNEHPIHDGVKACAVSRPEAIDYENGPV